MATLRQMITRVRIKIKDTSIRNLMDPEIIAALNEGKDELVKIIRQAHENYFEEPVTGTIAAVSAPNYSTITLPADFAELRDIQITDEGQRHTAFVKMNQSDPRFQQALRDGGGLAAGSGVVYYDFLGENTLILAPGFDLALGYKMHYIRTVPDMVLPTDTPSGIPAEHHGYIETWAVCECMRSLQDDRISSYESKLEFQGEQVKNSINTRQIKEPEFVVGYMEEENW